MGDKIANKKKKAKAAARPAPKVAPVVPEMKGAAPRK
ncbi:MAG: malic enzyme [Sulfitobacter sp.]